MHLILDPRAMADHLVAPRHQSAKPFGCRIGRPDLGQIAGRIEAGQRPGVDLVGLYMGVRDRLHLQRIGDHHALHERRQDPRHRHAVAGGLDHHLVGGQKLLAETFQRRTRHVDPAHMPQPAGFPDHHLAKGAVGIDPDHTSHPCLLSIKSEGSGGATRQLRIRALSATGRVAEAATY